MPRISHSFSIANKRVALWLFENLLR